MSPACDNCGSHVSARYYRVRKGNDGDLHGCPDCASPAAREREAAGVSGHTAVVGADSDEDTNGEGTGSAYLFGLA